MCVIFKISHIFYFIKKKGGKKVMDFNAFVKKNYNDNERIARMSINAPEHNYMINTYHYSALQLADIDCSENNLYFALNPMRFIDHSIRRDKQHVARLKFLYVDLDVYKSQWKDYSHVQILMQLESDYFGSKIPTPSYVVNSGRGMYLLWRIDEHINAQPRWEQVQRYLHSQLIEFGADNAVVTDTARVLRIPGSINSKSGTEVSIMQCNDRTYTLYEIMQEYMYDDLLAHKYIAKKSRKRNYKKSSKVIFMNTPYSLYNARVSDLEQLLLVHRDKESGMRENILFLYRYFTLCICNDKQDSLTATLQLNSRLKHPLNEKEVIKATSSAEKYYDADKSFQISNAKLIEFLNINSSEMKDLKSIISHTVKMQRKALRDRKAYLNKLAKKGEHTKEYKIKRRLKALYELLEQGLTQKEICKELEISRSTFYTDKKELANYTYKMLCEFTEDNIIDSTVAPVDNMHINEGTNVSPENSALVLREDVVLVAHSHKRQKDIFSNNSLSTSSIPDIECDVGVFPEYDLAYLLNSS